jgi:hypothetical protein
MAQGYGRSKKRPVGRMISYGAVSISLYSAVLTHQGLITTYFTKGATYAVLPIITAFLFSFVHGGFTNYFWSVMGIEAKKSAVVRQRPEAERTDRRERPQPQPRLRAEL